MYVCVWVLTTAGLAKDAGRPLGLPRGNRKVQGSFTTTPENTKDTEIFAALESIASGLPDSIRYWVEIFR